MRETTRCRRQCHILATALAALLAASSAARADTGDLTIVECLTSTNLAAGCSDLASTTDSIQRLSSLVVSADGLDAYAYNAFDAALIHFEIDPDSGALSFADCINSDVPLLGCTYLGPTNDVLEGSDNVTIRLSPDGASLYAVVDSKNAIAHFRTTSGALAFDACWTSFPASVDNCTDLSATTNALRHPQSVAVSPDGGHVYVTSDTGQAIVHFTRGGTGSLTFADCLTSIDNFTTGCTDISDTTNAFLEIEPIVVSPDGSSVYAGTLADTIVHLARDSGGGLSFQSCITTGNDGTPITGCTDISGSTNALEEIIAESLALSPDGDDLYAGSNFRDSVLHFSLSASGSPSFVGCLTVDPTTTGCSVIPTTDSLISPRYLAVSPDGRSLYAGSASQEALVNFSRDTTTGSLTFQECLTTDSTTVGCSDLGDDFPGALTTVRGIDVAPDGSAVYAVGIRAAVRFTREPGDCLAADGEELTLSDDTVTDEQTFEVCDTLRAGPNFHVSGPSGFLTLRAGQSVILDDGFSVGVDGRLTVDLDPTLGM